LTVIVNLRDDQSRYLLVGVTITVVLGAIAIGVFPDIYAEPMAGRFRRYEGLAEGPPEVWYGSWGFFMGYAIALPACLALMQWFPQQSQLPLPLSLKDWISTQPLDKKVYIGIRNNINYQLKIKRLIEKKNYTFTMALGAGNHGNYLITLYKVEMLLSKDRKEDKFEFLLTKQLSLRPDFTLSGDGENE